MKCEHVFLVCRGPLSTRAALHVTLTSTNSGCSVTSGKETTPAPHWWGVVVIDREIDGLTTARID